MSANPTLSHGKKTLFHQATNPNHEESDDDSVSETQYLSPKYIFKNEPPPDRKGKGKTTPYVWTSREEFMLTKAWVDISKDV